MYVCVCRAVTDRQIREAAMRGTRTLRDLRREFGIARECGNCAACARDCLREAHAAQAASKFKAVFANHVGSSAGEPAEAETAWRGACAPVAAGVLHEESRVESNHCRAA